MTLAGIDGCRGGWLCVTERDGEVTAVVAPTLAAWLAAARPDLAVIDMPIGLPDAGPRECDHLARTALRPWRANSIFPAPVRGALGHPTYEAACVAHRAIDGRAISKQAWFILPRIAEVDALLQTDRAWRDVLHEGHPELSFATWNGTPMRHAKRTPAGRVERLALVEATWPGAATRSGDVLTKGTFRPDDVLDAFAVLWTARRLAVGAARHWPERPPTDGTGLTMGIVA